MSLLIKNGLIVTSDAQYNGDVYVEQEKIKAIGVNLNFKAKEVIDASGKYILPGAIDSHTHLCMPYMGTYVKDDYKTGSIAAACGGVTCILDFNTQRNGETLYEALERKKKLAKGNSAVDFSLHPSITEPKDNIIKEIKTAITDYGTPSFKAYMTYDFRLDDYAILRMLEKTKKYGGIVQVHAENFGIIEYLNNSFEKKKKLSIPHHPKSRPNIAEAEAISRAAKLAEITGGNLYIVHLSSKEGLKEVMRAKDKGVNIIAETCPQYLVLDESRYFEPEFNGAKYVMSPPLRDKQSCEALWEGIRRGYISTVGTDHCPFDLNGMKDMFGKDDYRKIPNGAPGIETLMTLIHSEGVAKGKITLQQMVKILSVNTAKIFGLKNKGSICPGKDADIVIFNPKIKFNISYKKLHMNVDYNPYEGFEIAGMPEIVYVRGKKAAQFKNDRVEFVGEIGRGRFIKREPSF